jgi:antitoxin HicB
MTSSLSLGNGNNRFFSAVSVYEPLREEVTAAAIKRVIAWQLAEAMKRMHITKTEMAARMHTSRAVVNRLLDEDDTSITLATLSRASLAVGIPLKIELQ